MSDRTLCHYTITTGHARTSPRSEVSAEAIEALRPLLRTGLHVLPGPPGYRLRVTVAGRTLAATVYSGEAPLVTSFIVLDQAGLGAALRASGAFPRVPITLPAVLDDVHETASLDHDAMSWTGDLARCLGWAWVEHAP